MGYCCVCGRCWCHVSVSNSLLFTVTDFCAGRTSQTHGSDLSDDLSFLTFSFSTFSFQSLVYR
jgi:hypothetical protein